MQGRGDLEILFLQIILRKNEIANLRGEPNFKSNSSVQFLSDQKVFRFYRFSADCPGKYAARGKRPFSIDRKDRKMFFRGASCGNRTLGAFNFKGKTPQVRREHANWE